MTTSRETQIAAERLRKQAKEREQQWRQERGYDAKLRGKRSRKPKPKRLPLERGEVRRREERKRQRIDREALRVPLLKGVGPESQKPQPAQRASLPKASASNWRNYKASKLGSFGAAGPCRKIEVTDDLRVRYGTKSQGERE